jgi:lysophospholipase L1-like esterase
VTKDAGILPVLITQPTLAGPVRDPATGIDLGRISLDTWRWGEKINGETGWRILESYNDVTRNVAEEAGLPLIDLAQIMPKSTKYFYDIIHFTDAGAKIVASIVYDNLCPILRDNYRQFMNFPCR